MADAVRGVGVDEVPDAPDAHLAEVHLPTAPEYLSPDLPFAPAAN